MVLVLNPVIELEKAPIPVPSDVFVESEIVGEVVVELQHTPLAVTVTPPSLIIFPPLIAEFVVILVATVVELNIGVVNVLVVKLI